TPLIDPLCGSGTLLCEALMHYCRIPSGYLRNRFGFMHLPDYDPALWTEVKKEADGKMRILPQGLISGSDRSSGAVSSARKNCRTLPSGERVSLEKRAFQDIDRVFDATLVCNPPYGIRMGNNQHMAGFMKEFGDFLKQRCTGSTAYIYFGNRELIKSLGLRSSWKIPLKNGPLDGRLVKYELY
ncbi:MAG: class I SAM-dependent RNA methyltransferase, partial [Desulfomonilia bacterium]|nr:class I SAM-dependent RNA methyltransferase [Desulfomonilia bacterium]